MEFCSQNDGKSEESVAMSPSPRTNEHRREATITEFLEIQYLQVNRALIIIARAIFRRND